jgi:hypothetical protein
VGKVRTCGQNDVFRQGHGSNRIQNGNAQGGFRLDGDLVAEMAVRASRVIRGIVMMPVADDTGGKNRQNSQRQQNPEYANRLPHS